MIISVIIPTFQRNDLLAQCLDRLAPVQQPGLDVLQPGQAESPEPAEPFAYEVIVTDDGVSTTAETMIRQQYPWARWMAGGQPEPRSRPGPRPVAGVHR